jgi:hypothetical protein
MASQVLDRGAQADARSASRCLSQVLDHGAQAVTRGAARSASLVLDLGSQAVTHGVATLSQHEKKKLGKCLAEQGKYYRLYLKSGKLTLAEMYLRRDRFIDRTPRRR